MNGSFTKLINLSIMFLLSFTAEAFANKVISGSKRAIEVRVYSGSCDETKKGFEAGYDQWKQMKGSDLNQRIKASQSAAGGCKGPFVKVLEKINDSITVGPGELIVAIKEGGNPIPAICYAPNNGKDIILKTRKSETLRGILGKAGDLGLTCDFK